MATFISDLSLCQALVLDDVRLFEFYLNKKHIKIPFFIKKSCDQLISQKLEDWSKNPNCLESLPKVIAILMNNEAHRDEKSKKKDMSVLKTGFDIGLTIAVTSATKILEKSKKKEWVRKLNTKLDEEDYMMEAPNPNDSSDLSDNLKRKFANAKLTRDNNVLYITKRKLTRLRDLMSLKQSNRDYSWEYMNLINSDDCIFNSHFIIFSHQGKYIFNYDYLLMLNDLAIMRYNIKEFSIINHQVLNYNMPHLSVLNAICSWFDKNLMLHGNDSYDLFKRFESICIGVYQVKYESVTACRRLLDNLVNDTEEKFISATLDLIDILGNTANANQLFEIFGLYRLGGHPIVDETSGCTKLRDLTRKEIDVNPDGILISFGCFIKEFIMNYVKDNRIWPSINFEKTKENLINNRIYDVSFLTYLKKQSLSFTFYDDYRDFKLWGSISFNKIFEFNDFEDFTELISDTAISPELDKYLTAYAKELIGHSLFIPDKTERRTLIAILKSKDFSIKKIREVFESGNIPDSWKVIALHSKERELKKDPRLFAMFTIEMRMLMAALEKNLADGIFKYIKMQTMTMSEAELNDKLTDMTNPNKHSDYIPFLISMDMEKFNQRWRVESLSRTTQFLDEIYGVDSYHRCMKFYRVAFLYLSSRFHPPSYMETQYERDGIKFFQETSEESNEYNKAVYDILYKQHTYLDTDTTWVGQLGGTEGTMQKLWTLTVGQPILYTQYQTGIQSTQIGQGDNQNVLILIKKEDIHRTRKHNMIEYDKILSDTVDSYIMKLKKNLEDYGMILKLEETYCNSELLNYGKEILYLGCYVSNTLKRISRMLSDVNDTYPTLDARVASIYSAAHSTSLKGFDYILPYMFAIREVIDCLNSNIYIHSKKYKNLIEVFSEGESKLSENFYYGCVLLGKDFGGFPIIPFFDLMFRGHPDPLTSYLSWINCLSQEIPMAKLIKDYISSLKLLKPTEDLMSVIMDPTCINWVTDNNMRNESKQLLEDNLREMVVNKDIKQLFEYSSRNDQEDLKKFLYSIRPFFARGINEIFRQTADGVILQFLSMFKDMKTIKHALPHSHALRIFTLLKESDYKRLKTVGQAIYDSIHKEQVNKLPDDLANWKCTTRIAKYMREYSFGTDIIGSTMPHPTEQTILFECSGGSCNRCDITENFNAYIFYKVIDTLSNYDFFHTRGICGLYNGSSTKEKRAKSIINFSKKDRSLYGCQRIMRISDWISDKNSNIYNFLMSLIESRTDIPLDIIALSAGKNFGGSAIHRFQDVILSHSCRPNTRPNHTSNVYISTDKMGDYARGKDNYLMMFQALMLYGYSMIGNIACYSDSMSPQCYHLHIGCYDCSEIVEEVKMFTDEPIPKLKKYKESKLIFSSIIDIDQKIKSDDNDLLHIVSPDDVNDPQLKFKMAVFSASVIMYATISHHYNPLYVKKYETEREHYKINLTIDDLIKLNIIDILKLTGSIWFLDNISDILRYKGGSTLNLLDTCIVLLGKMPTQNFKYLYEIALIPEVLDQLIRFSMPNSPDFMKDGKGLNGCFLSAMIIGIEETIRGNIVIPLLMTYNNMQIIRMIRMGIINCIFNTYENWEECDMQEIIRTIEQLRHKHSIDNQLDISQWLIALLTTCKFDSDDISFMFDNRILISSCGPEAWISAGKNLYNIKRTNECPNYPSLLERRNFEDSLKVLNQKNNKCTIIRSFIPSDDIPDYNADITTKFNKEKDRSEHRARLTGIYSSACLKYLDVLSTCDLVSDMRFNLSAHLGEGTGGLAEAFHILFGTKTCLYNDMFDITKMIPHRGINYIPPCLLEHVLNGTIKVLGIDMIIDNGGDMTLISNINYFKEICSRHDSPIILTCDAETSGDHDHELAKKICMSFVSIFETCPEGSVGIFKAFFNNYSRLLHQMNLIFNVTDQIEVCLSRFSSKQNTECFLVIKRKKVQNNAIFDSSLVNNLDLRRFLNKVNLDDIAPSEARDLRDSMIMIGFRSNFASSIKLMIGESSIGEPSPTNVSLYCDHIKRSHILYIKQRMNQILKLAEDYNKADRIMKQSSSSDHIDMNNSSIIIVNCLIINEIYLQNKEWKTVLYDPPNIKYRGKDIFKPDIDINIWCKKYIKAARHIEGHLYKT